MTVKELIEKLREIPLNAIVFDDDGYPIRSVFWDSNKTVMLSRTNYDEEQNDG